MRIYAPHPDIDEPKTYATASAAVGATAVTVSNNGGFAANDYTVLGIPGSEGATINKISTVSGNATLNYVGDALKFAISSNTPITFIKYNQVRFYLGDWSARYATGTIKATKGSAVITGTGTSWGAITTNYALLLNGKWYDIKSVDSATQITLTDTYEDDTAEGQSYALVGFSLQATSNIAIDQENTVWEDTDAVAEDFYRTEYYNSTSTAVSARSSIISGAETEGFSEFSVRNMEDQILSELRDKNAKRRSRDEIDKDLNDCLRELIRTIVAHVQEDYLSAYTTIDFVANVGEYKLPDDFKKKTAIWISYTGVSTDYLRADKMTIADDDPNADYSQSTPLYYLRDNLIGVKPVPTGAVTAGIKMWYERRIPSFKYEGDEIPQVLRDYRRLFIDYAMDKALTPDDGQKAMKYRVDFKNGKDEMVLELKDRDLSVNKAIEVVCDYDLYD